MVLHWKGVVGVCISRTLSFSISKIFSNTRQVSEHKIPKTEGFGRKIYTYRYIHLEVYLKYIDRQTDRQIDIRYMFILGSLKLAFFIICHVNYRIRRVFKQQILLFQGLYLVIYHCYLDRKVSNDLQRCIPNPIKNLRWSFLSKQLTTFNCYYNYFCKKEKFLTWF